MTLAVGNNMQSQDVWRDPTPTILINRNTGLQRVPAHLRASYYSYDLTDTDRTSYNIEDRISFDHNIRSVSSKPHDYESHSLYCQFMDMRFRHVLAEGWNTGNTRNDIDHYDSDDAHSHNVLASRQSENGGIFTAGARLTPVDSVASSLSFNMMRNNPQMQQELAHSDIYTTLEEAAQQGNLFDLTRLVTDDSASTGEKIHALLQVFGGGLGVTGEQSQDPIWMYVTTPQMSRFLTWLGIPFSPVVTGKVSPQDNYSSTFSVVYPARALAAMPQEKSVYKTVVHARDSLAPSSDPDQIIQTKATKEKPNLWRWLTAAALVIRSVII